MASPGAAAHATSQKLHVFLTGRPGVGKTTAVKRTVELLVTSSHGKGDCSDVVADGFYTEERRERGVRVGFDVVTLGGVRKSLADVIPDQPDPSRRRPRHVVGRYAVNVVQFESVALPVMLKCMAGLTSSRNQVAVIDEVGKMEAFSAEFLQCVRSLLDSSGQVHIIGTIPQLGKSYPASLSTLLQQIRSHPHCMVLEVTERNRRDIPQQIIGLLFGSTST